MYVPRSEKSQTITRVTISRRPSPITRSHRLLCMCVCMRVYVYTYPPRVSRSIYECTWEVYREILPWITTYARYEIRQTYLEDSSQETTRWPDTIKALPTRRDPPTKRDAHRCSHSYCIYIYIVCIIRETIFVIIDVSPMALFYPYIWHTREKRGRCGKEVSPHLHRLFSFLGRLTHRKCQSGRLFPSTVSFRSLLPLLLFLRSLFLCPMYLFLFLDQCFSSKGSLSFFLPPFLFLVRSARESRLACRLRSTRNAIRKERTVGELPHRSSGERKECRDVGVRGRNVKESVVNRPIYCLSSLFPSSRSGQFRIFNWTTRYLLPILSLCAFFSGSRAISTDWLGHFTSLIWELCGEIGRSLIGTRVYNIKESLMEFEICNLFKERIPM